MDEHRLTLRAELVRTQQDARALIQRGVIMIALVPALLAVGVVGLLSLSSYPGVITLLAAAGYALFGGIGGLAATAAGLADHRRSTKELRAFDASYTLPEARLVRR